MNEQDTIDRLKELEQAYRKLADASKAHPCPSCGYCPHCGRSGHQMVPYYPQPYYPYAPWYPPQITWTTGNDPTYTSRVGDGITTSGTVY